MVHIFTTTAEQQTGRIRRPHKYGSDLLLQLNRWNEEEEYQKIIEAVEAPAGGEEDSGTDQEMLCL